MLSGRKDTIQVLQFFLQDIRFCVEITYVEKVVPLVTLESIPSSPPYLAGLMNLAGKSVPVIDLSMRLGLKRSKHYTLDTLILLSSEGNSQTGLIIDKVLGLTNVEPQAIQMNEEFNKPDSLFQAAITFETEVSLLLNIPNILGFRFYE